MIETDHKSIEFAYFYEHPINLWEVKDYDDITIGEFNNSISARFQDFLNRLCEMKSETSPEKQGIYLNYKTVLWALDWYKTKGYRKDILERNILNFVCKEQE